MYYALHIYSHTLYMASNKHKNADVHFHHAMKTSTKLYNF